MINRLLLGVCAVLSGCVAHRQPPSGHVTYTIGNPYQTGGQWHYPREFNQYDATGLGIIIRHDSNPYTADGEVYDAEGLMAASPVLPLPSIVTVTNLVNGYSVQVRVNERGPNVPGRVIAVTPRVARLLRFPTGGVVEVQVKLDSAASAALQASLGAGPKLSAAPVVGITEQSLAAPGGGTTSRAQQIGPASNASMRSGAPRLTGQVTTILPAPGPLWVRVSGFGNEGDAARMMARLYGFPARLTPVFGGDRTLWAVDAGPYHSVAAADQALQEVLRRGVAGPEIVVR
ncbi:RlpA-like double-psi beta-barrel domain-containing protein [Acidocella aminolytica]|uniref:Lipoprotein n=1 Tax=Acidocella aminolytica 101 = DSM 11237 TaxID=1120923 RepID=A0A0D6PEX7_9PROT|nr:RlpA-like double-psi beta-barrel domain-containing protein [Acidocella aminolytica]GAN79414.1 lipoprotein [Acidocella aminolytica 101 = DSM 11237]GBQ43868.1 hypothetical protein AA11237_3415 [Acidocella aminolytica 101 = DSM 11237]SHE45353.1 rare lipoprotein A [Acidocella aminolytica 101 = DSM 11237]